MDDEKKFKEQLSEFPCTFHFDFKHVNKMRLKERNNKLELELNNSTPELRKLNLLMFLYYTLDESPKALELTKHPLFRPDNIISLANKAYILWAAGNEFDAVGNLKKLKLLKSNPIFHTLKQEALAELAYTCKKIGGPLNLSRAIDLYTEYLVMNPQDMDMTLELGITYRRTTHPRIAKSEFFKNDALVNRVKKAADNFFRVTDDDTNAKNQARAYSELAVMRTHIQAYVEIKQCQSIFLGYSSRRLCIKALEPGGEDYRTLCECGRILHRFDWNYAIEVLEKSAKMMPHSVTYHHLALAYGRRARRLQSEKYGIQWKSISIEEDVQSAIKYFEKAVEISLEENIPALLNYGQFLKSCRKFKDAIVKFNKVIRLTTNSLSDKDPLSFEHAQQANIVSSCEQIGLCYLALYDLATGRSFKTSLFDYNNETQPGCERSDSDAMDYSEMKLPSDEVADLDLKISPDEIEELKDKAESKLMQSISLAARYANKAPHAYPINVWKSYVIIEHRYKYDEYRSYRELFKLLDVCRQHEKVFQLTEDLISHNIEQLKQTDVFLGALRSYIALGKYDLALAFFHLLMSDVEIDDVHKLKLEMEINLLAVASRLQQPDENVIDEFQHVLDLHFQASTDKHASNGQNSQDCSPENQREYLDVLILYNEDCPEGEQCSKSEIMARKLKKFLKENFKLRVNCNKEREFCGPRFHPDEMLFYKAVVAILDDETARQSYDTSVFKEMLNRMSAINVHCTGEGLPVPTTTLALPSRNGSAVIPINLRHIPKCYLDEVLSLTAAFEDSSCETTLPNYTDQSFDGLSPVRNYIPPYKLNPVQGIEAGSNHPKFSPRVTDLMEFFCLLLNREWPSCEETEMKMK